MLPAELDREVERLAAERGSSKSGLITRLIRLGIAAQSGEGDPLLRYLGSLDGPPDLSETVDETVYQL